MNIGDRTQYPDHSALSLLVGLDNPSLLSQVAVTAQVLDVNDNAPEVATDEEVIVCESSRPGQVGDEKQKKSSGILSVCLSVCLSVALSHSLSLSLSPPHLNCVPPHYPCIDGCPYSCVLPLYIHHYMQTHTHTT